MRRRTADDLIDSYAKYVEMPLSEHLKSRYFPGDITEFHCLESDLRWFSPTPLGDSDFYEHLGTFPGYYDSETWDKLRTIELLKQYNCREFVDIGCGKGLLLSLAKARGLAGFGVELNRDASQTSASNGLTIYDVDAPELNSKRPDFLVSLQTLEHVRDPKEWLASHLQTFQPKYGILAVPCHDTVLGKTSDPLVWPPHHATLWSGKALEVLAASLGYEIVLLEYEPISWWSFNFVLERQPNSRKLEGLPAFPRGRAGSLLFKVLHHAGIAWIRRAHTALAVLRRCQPGS